MMTTKNVPTVEDRVRQRLLLQKYVIIAQEPDVTYAGIGDTLNGKKPSFVQSVTVQERRNKMEQYMKVTCGTCDGIGGWTSWRYYLDDDGNEVKEEIWNTCGTCGGTGEVDE